MGVPRGHSQQEKRPVTDQPLDGIQRWKFRENRVSSVLLISKYFWSFPLWLARCWALEQVGS